MHTAFLSRSTDGKHKYEVRIFKPDDSRKRAGSQTREGLIKFGAFGYGDYTLGTSDMQKRAYIARHKYNEDWTKTGYFKAGFWSRWLLWNKRTILESIRDIEKRFSDIKIFLI